MTDRDRLIELINNVTENNVGNILQPFGAETLADYLLANGVIVPPVEIVRCKDCIHYKPQSISSQYNSTKPYCRRVVSVKVNENDYCSYGKLKEREGVMMLSNGKVAKMPDKKLTDNEIVKGLELCLKNECEKCCFNGSEVCQIELMKLLFDLINRLQAENERLKNAYKQCAWERDTFTAIKKEEIAKLIKKTKAEAYKEFVKRLEKEMEYEHFFETEVVVLDKIKLHNLLKKVGE